MRLIFSLLLLISILPLQAQQGTTLEEYRYLTKGYAYQIEMGLDATKDGYQFRDLYSSANGIEFLGMYLTGQSVPQAILAIFTSSNAKPIYLCLPNNQSASEVAELCAKDRSNLLGYQNQKNLEVAMQELLFAQLGSSHSTANTQASAQRPADYATREVFTARGGTPEPLVASANSAPSYPVSQPNHDFLPAQESPAANSNVATSPEVIAFAENAPASDQKTSLAQFNVNLDNRAVNFSPELVISAQKKGIVVVKFCVNQKGAVTFAKFTQRGSTTLDQQLIDQATEHAAKMQFQESSEDSHCGTISYSFNL